MTCSRPPRPPAAVPGRTCCHEQQEAQVVGGGRGLDLAAQAVEHAPVDARQQPPIAPLWIAPRPSAADQRSAAQDGALHLDARQRGVDIGHRDIQTGAEDRGRRRAQQRQVRAHDLGQRAFALGPGRRAARRRLDDVGHEAALGPDRRRPATRRSAATQKGRRPAARAAPRGAPRRARRSARPSRAPAPAPTGSAPSSSSRSCSSSAFARVGLRLGDHLGDARRVEAADALDDLGRQPAPHGDRARAPLLQRGVVEEGVRVRVQDLVREHRRLGQLARDGLDLARRAGPSARGAARRRPSPRSGSRAASRAPAGGRGISMAPPPWLSWQAVCAGKTAAIRSCARMRWIGGGTRRPP